MWPQGWSMINPQLNGATFLSSKSFANGVSARCWGSGTRFGCQIETPDISVRLDTAPPYNYYAISMKRRSGKFQAVGKCDGICGGNGWDQVAQGYQKKYPCKTCKPGGAYRTVICKCEEWAVPKAKALVSDWQAVTADEDPEPLKAQLAQFTTTHKSQLAQSTSVSAERKKCLLVFKKFQTTKRIIAACEAGQCSKDLKALYDQILDLAKDCGEDLETTNGKGESQEEFNLEEGFCGELREEVDANHEEKRHLCPLIKLCHKVFPKQGDHDHLQVCS